MSRPLRRNWFSHSLLFAPASVAVFISLLNFIQRYSSCFPICSRRWLVVWRARADALSNFAMARCDALLLAIAAAFEPHGDRINREREARTRAPCRERASSKENKGRRDVGAFHEFFKPFVLDRALRVPAT